MTQTITVDVSAIVDGQGIDAADVTTPIANLKTAIENVLNGAQGVEDLLLVEISTPANPAAGKQKLYVKSTDNLLYLLDSSGTETQVGVTQEYPKRWLHRHADSTVTAGNALALMLTPPGAYQNTAADGDTFEFGVFVAAGTYSLAIRGLEGTGEGIKDWYLDDVSIDTGQDWYAGSTSYVQKTISSIVIADGGWHVLKCVTNGKNASATDYKAQLTEMALKQASD
jgi:hypothetical protein